jgi:hypothetical protein
MHCSGKSSFVGAAIIVSAVVACALTNPSKQEHLDAISDKNALVGGIAQVASFLGGVGYNNYIVCSILTADNTLTFGEAEFYALKASFQERVARVILQLFQFSGPVGCLGLLTGFFIEACSPIDSLNDARASLFGHAIF